MAKKQTAYKLWNKHKNSLELLSRPRLTTEGEKTLEEFVFDVYDNIEKLDYLMGDASLGKRVVTAYEILIKALYEKSPYFNLSKAGKEGEEEKEETAEGEEAEEEEKEEKEEIEEIEEEKEETLEVEEGKPEKELEAETAETEAGVREDFFPDIYSILGVGSFASRIEIDKAYRKLEREYTSGINVGSKENQEKLRDIGIAYEMLTKQKNIYDAIRSKAKEDETLSRALPKLPSSEIQPIVKYHIKLKTPKDDITSANAKEFRAFVKSLGRVGVDPDTKTLISPLLPKGFDADQLTSALNLYADGHRSEDIEAAIDKWALENPDMSRSTKETAYGPVYLMRTFEDFNLKGNKDFLREVKTIITSEQVEKVVKVPVQKGIELLVKGEKAIPKGVHFATDLLTGELKNKAKAVVGKYVKKAVKSVGKKLAKEAAKKGIGIALKAGVQAAAQALGTTVPVIGNVVMFVITEVVPRVVGFVKRQFSKFINWARRHKEDVAAAAIALGVTGLLFGNPFILLGGLFFGGLAFRFGGFAAFITGLWAAFVLPVASIAAGSALIFLAIAIVFTSFAYLIITSSAYVVPRGGFNVSPVGVTVSPYISVEKLASSTNPPRDQAPRQEYANSDLPLTVTYDVTITATQGTLTNVTISYTCNVQKNPPPNPNCPPDPDIPQPPGGQISPTNPFTFRYGQTYDGQYQDSSIVDSITVTADAVDATGQTSAASASLCIGDCPESCPEGWPVTSGYITQGPDSGYSHALVEAIDIGTNGRSCL
jgi:curved DNA-binding protein CbpA